MSWQLYSSLQFMDNNKATAFGLLSIVAKCNAVFCNTTIVFTVKKYVHPVP
jgi:hypothetical protein